MAEKKTKSSKIMLLFSVAISFVIVLFCLCFNFKSNGLVAFADSERGGAFVLESGETKTIEDFEKYSGYNVSIDGGVGLINAGATLTMNGGMIVGNSAQYGGAFYVNGGTLIINGGVIYNNTATSQGGAILTNSSNNSSTVVINGGTISDCDYIPVMMKWGGSFEMNGGTITSKNIAIRIDNSNATVNLNGGSVIGNFVSYSNVNIKTAFDLYGSITLTDTANTVTVVDYDGTTPRLNIELKDSRVAGPVVTFKGSTTKPNLDRINITGYNKERFVQTLIKDSSGNWQVKVFTVTDGNLRDATGGKVYAYSGQTSMTDDYRQNGTAVQPGFGNGQKWTGPVAEVNDGYDFKGWYDNAECSGTPVSTELSFSIITDNNKASYVYYAKFEKQFIYTRVNENNEEDANGNYVLFGSFPQTLKEESVTIDENNVDENGYFLGSDGERYAKIQANVYNSSTDYFFDDYETSIVNGEYYYFKVEKLRWRILAIENGEATLFCDNIIYSSIFGSSKTYNDSDVRTWLNDTLYNQAFSSIQQGLIKTTTVGDGMNTQDDIWMFNVDELMDTSYSFEATKEALAIRAKKTTDYARACGAMIDNDDQSDTYLNGTYWTITTVGLRSIQYVDIDGNLNSSSGANFRQKGYGIVPVLILKL